MDFQTTLSGAVVFSGVGLHSGERVRATVRPAAMNTGIVFRRTDLPEGENEIELRPDAVADTQLGTTISNRFGASVATVEHLLAALVGVGVNNAVVDVDGPEIPAMDGSARPFVKVLARAGLDRLAAPRQVIRVLKTIEVSVEGKRARFEPADNLEIDATITFDDPAIGRQRALFEHDPARFADEIAPARTFAFLHDVEALHEAGLARGGSLENCVVLNADGVMNEDGLRYADEFARHKVLDILGDLALAGRMIFGRYVAERPGHALNNLALRELMADPDAWRLESLGPDNTLSGAKAAGRRPAATLRPATA